jgi:hypothetical protein
MIVVPQVLHNNICVYLFLSGERKLRQMPVLSAQGHSEAGLHLQKVRLPP